MRKLGRKIAARKSLMRNLSSSLILFEKIETTEAKGKEVKSIVDKMIGIGKTADLNSYRKLLAFFYDKNAAKKIQLELSKRYLTRTSGFVRLYHLENRLGDNAPMVRLELVDRKIFSQKKKETKKIDAEEKIEPTKKEIRAEKKLEKLTATKKQSGVVTTIRTKSARKTGTSN